MVKTVQTIVHRLKDEESTEDTAKESKREVQTVSVKDVGVKVRDSIIFQFCKEFQRLKCHWCLLILFSLPSNALARKIVRLQNQFTSSPPKEVCNR